MNKHEWVLNYMSIRDVTIDEALSAYDKIAGDSCPAPGKVVLVMHVGDAIPDGMQGKYIRVCAV